MSDHSRARARERLASLSRAGHDLVTFWRSCSEVLAAEIPHHLSPCWYTLDPDSLLITSHVQDGIDHVPTSWLAQEYAPDEVHTLVEVARSERGVSTLHAVTGGDPTATRRWQENIVHGGDQELIAALRSADGAVWGAVGLYRAPGAPMFDHEDLAFLASVAPILATGARRALLLGEATDPEWPDAPGLVMIRADLTVESSTAAAERLLARLPGADIDREVLPPVVFAVAGHALAAAGVALPGGREARPDLGLGMAPDPGAGARVRGADGAWVTVHGMVLGEDGARRAAIVVEPAHPARIVPLLMAAYGLTDREQQVTRAVLSGRSTDAIAEQLAISPYTVQEHLKHVFDKVGVRSRRDLAGRVFRSHYEPRVRDNERRAMDARPLRGGPAAGVAAP